MDESVNIRELNDLIASKSSFVNLITQGMDQTIVGQKHLVNSLLISLLAEHIVQPPSTELRYILNVRVFQTIMKKSCRFSVNST